MVTYIIQVHYANALQLVKDLQPLLPSYAKLTANESANALVLTDTQADIRRMTEIVSALDTSISSISTVRVFPLKYADAKQLADTIPQLFQSPTSQQNAANHEPILPPAVAGSPVSVAFGGAVKREAETVAGHWRQRGAAGGIACRRHWGRPHELVDRQRAGRIHADD